MGQRDEEIRQAYLDNGWEEEVLDNGCRIFTTKMSDRILTTKLSEETEYKLRRFWGEIDVVKDAKYQAKKFNNWIHEMYVKTLERFGTGR